MTTKSKRYLKKQRDYVFGRVDRLLFTHQCCFSILVCFQPAFNKIDTELSFAVLGLLFDDKPSLNCIFSERDDFLSLQWGSDDVKYSSIFIMILFLNQASKRFLDDLVSTVKLYSTKSVNTLLSIIR